MSEGPLIAGAWYPGSPKALGQQVKGFLDGVPDQSFPARLTTLISPHAGYPYSGQVAAYSAVWGSGTEKNHRDDQGRAHRLSQVGADGTGL
jgi:AmmeMemoRadiSam system protein B